MNNSLCGALIGVVLGWALTLITRHFEEVLFGAKLSIRCNGSGVKDETPDFVYMRFRVANTTERHVAKNCRAYLVELYKISNGKEISENLTADTFQLPWAGSDFEARDIPAKVNHFVNLVRFAKHEPPRWRFHTKPPLYKSLEPLVEYRGTYRFTVVVAGDGATPQTKRIYVDYNGDWRTVPPPYE